MNPRAPIILAAVHLAAVTVHGAAHFALGIFDDPAATAFVLIVIHGLPLAASVLLMRGKLRPGLSVLGWSLLASVLYATYKHFIGVSQDHVGHLPPGTWAHVFQISAVLISLIDIAGLLLVLRWARQELLPQGRHVLLIDGTCIMCHRIVAYVLGRDRAGTYHFGHLQSDYGRRVRSKHGADVNDIDGIYLLLAEGTAEERLLIDGAAGRHLWPSLHMLATPLLLLPVALLNPSYTFFAKIRYRVFGQFQACHVPTPEERKRFVASE